MVARLAVSSDSTGSESTSASAVVAVVAVDSEPGTAFVEGLAVAARVGSKDLNDHGLDQACVATQSLERTGSDRQEWEVNDPSIYLLLPKPNHQHSQLTVCCY